MDTSTSIKELISTTPTKQSEAIVDDILRELHKTETVTPHTVIDPPKEEEETTPKKNIINTEELKETAQQVYEWLKLPLCIVVMYFLVHNKTVYNQLANWLPSYENRSHFMHRLINVCLMLLCIVPTKYIMK